MTNYRTQTANILNDADKFEDILSWQLFAADQDTRAFAPVDVDPWDLHEDEREDEDGTWTERFWYVNWSVLNKKSDWWRPGIPLHTDPRYRLYEGRQHVRQMIEERALHAFHDEDQIQLYDGIRCDECETVWYGDIPCFSCGRMVIIEKFMPEFGPLRPPYHPPFIPGPPASFTDVETMEYDAEERNAYHFLVERNGVMTVNEIRSEMGFDQISREEMIRRNNEYLFGVETQSVEYRVDRITSPEPPPYAGPLIESMRRQLEAYMDLHILRGESRLEPIGIMDEVGIFVDPALHITDRFSLDMWARANPAMDWPVIRRLSIERQERALEIFRQPDVRGPLYDTAALYDPTVSTGRVPHTLLNMLAGVDLRDPHRREIEEPEIDVRRGELEYALDRLEALRGWPQDRRRNG